jgi:cytochrome c-type biogenesis protein CcmH/NrfG
MDNNTIKKYLANELSPIERNAFEQEMENDPFLKESIEGWLQDETQIPLDKINTIENDLYNSIDNSIISSKKKKNTFINVVKLAVAACIISIISLTVYRTFFTSKNVDEQKIYANYFKPLTNTDVIVRGENDTTIETKAAAAYEKEDYFEAVNVYQKIVANNPNNVKNNLFLGISFLATNQPKKAIEIFNNIIQSEEFHYDIRWYLALAYIKNKELQNATTILKTLTKEENYYQKDAVEILNEIDGKVALK